MLRLIQKEKKKRMGRNAKDRTIIVTPLSLIDQWISELSKIADPKCFKIVNWYGQKRKKITMRDLEQCDVVLSTHDTFKNIHGTINKEWDDFMGESYSSAPKRSLISKLASGFFSRIVVDEAHELRNANGSRCQVIAGYAEKCANKCIENRAMQTHF